MGATCFLGCATFYLPKARILNLQKAKYDIFLHMMVRSLEMEDICLYVCVITYTFMF